MYKKILLFAAFIVLTVSAAVYAENPKAPAIGENDFFFAGFKYGASFDGESARALYGEQRIMEITEEKLLNGLPPCTLYGYESAVFAIVDGKIAAAASTCATGAAPRGLTSGSSPEDIGRLFGEPIRIDPMSRGEMFVYNLSDEHSGIPIFSIYISGRQNEAGKKPFSVGWGLAGYAAICQGFILATTGI